MSVVIWIGGNSIDIRHSLTVSIWVWECLEFFPSAQPRIVVVLLRRSLKAILCCKITKWSKLPLYSTRALIFPFSSLSLSSFSSSGNPLFFPYFPCLFFLFSFSYWFIRWTRSDWEICSLKYHWKIPVSNSVLWVLLKPFFSFFFIFSSSEFIPWGKKLIAIFLLCYLCYHTGYLI